MRKLFALVLGFALLAFASIVVAQAVSGNMAGTVVDKSGALVPGASVTVVNVDTGFTRSLTANTHGEFLFVDLPPGIYNITVKAAGFAQANITRFPVQLNRTNSVSVVLEVLTQNVTVEVSGAAPPINTSTPQIEGTFEARETADLPTASIVNGVLNFSLLQPGVATGGGIGYGTGPSVGGQRTTNNSFTIEGVDNNNKGVTGPLVSVPNDAVAEFSTLQNQFSPEFGHSNGGQFNIVVQSGTNNFHGKLYEYFENRKLDAIDNQVALNTPAGTSPSNPRFDSNRVGGQLGGPIIKDKLFFFANGEYDPFGLAGTPVPSLAPTAAGYATLNNLVTMNVTGPNPGGTGPAVAPSGNNLAQLQKYVTVAPTSNGSPIPICTGGTIPGGTAAAPTCALGTLVNVDVGSLQFTAPSYSNTYFLTTAADYNMSAKDQFRIRYIYNKFSGLDTRAQLPAFYTTVPQKFHLVAINEYHTFRPDLTNEFRLGFNRFTQAFPDGGFKFPGLDAFPNLTFADLGIQVGPDFNAPQANIQNEYSVSENLSWTHHKHNVRVGVDTRRYISPDSFTQRARGDYNYSSLGTYLYDINPDGLTERSTGSLIYHGDDIDTGWYINDQWRILPSVTFNYGMRYEYATISQGARLQSLNSAASVPGLIDFSEPRAPKNQFMPRVGFAWSPDKNRTWAVRGGMSMGYDVNYDNLGQNSITTGAAPQLGGTQDKDQTTAGILTNFLGSGGIPPGTGGFNTFPGCAAPCGTTGHGQTPQAQQQFATAGNIVVNQLNPVAITGTLGVQHTFAKNYTAEVRYVYTHGYHLQAQVRANRQAEVTPTLFIPSYLMNPGAAVLNSLSTNLGPASNPNSLAARGSFVPQYVAGCGAGPGGEDISPCFAGANITVFEPEASSVYHGLQTQLIRRFEHGLQFNLAYTYSHDIDDNTATLNSTTVSPRRPLDFLNLALDRGNSALDHRHRITLAMYYDLPYFKTGNWFRRNVLGNWLVAPIYTFQSGEWGDLQAASDVNLNGDSAGDRVLLNPAGNKSMSSTVTPLRATAGPNTGLTVAYLVNNPGAYYIRPGAGSLEPNNGLAVAGRNTILLRPINNMDITIGKKFSITEKLRFEFQGQFLNFFNHPQYIPGSINTITGNGLTTVTGQIVSYADGSAGGLALKASLTPTNPLFGRYDQVLSSNPRVIQLVVKLVF